MIQVVISSWTSCIMCLVTRMDSWTNYRQLNTWNSGTSFWGLRRTFLLLFADDWHLFSILAWYLSRASCRWIRQLFHEFSWKWRKERAPNYVPAGFGVVAFIYVPWPWGLCLYKGVPIKFQLKQHGIVQTLELFGWRAIVFWMSWWGPGLWQWT